MANKGQSIVTKFTRNVKVICEALENGKRGRYESNPFDVSELPLTKCQMLSKLHKYIALEDVVLVRATKDFLVPNGIGEYYVNDLEDPIDEEQLKPLDS